MNRATDEFRREHELILGVLDALSDAMDEWRRCGRVDEAVATSFVTFLREFVGELHRSKEDTLLMPELAGTGVSVPGSPLAMVADEHVQLERRLGALSHDRILELGPTLVTQLREHLDKEEHCLFGMADERIRGADLADLQRGCREHDERNREARERCQALAASLSAGR